MCDKKIEEHLDHVVDHDHFSGAFRDMAHKECNLELKELNYITIITHVSRKYDVHLSIKELSEMNDPKLTVEYLSIN